MAGVSVGAAGSALSFGPVTSQASGDRAGLPSKRPQSLEYIKRVLMVATYRKRIAGADSPVISSMVEFDLDHHFVRCPKPQDRGRNRGWPFCPELEHLQEHPPGMGVVWHIAAHRAGRFIPRWPAK